MTPMFKPQEIDYNAANNFIARATGANTMGRAEYLQWVTEWKQHYADLSTTIRAMWVSRKPYIYSYRPKGDDTTKRRIGRKPNPVYAGQVVYALVGLTTMANKMLRIRTHAKANAGLRMEAAYKASILQDAAVGADMLEVA